MGRLLHALSTRPCRDPRCPDLERGWHDAHLTLLGRWRYAGWRPWATR
jgi:hypothetical protein